jgi:hypothetical protein
LCRAGLAFTFDIRERTMSGWRWIANSLLAWLAAVGMMGLYSAATGTPVKAHMVGLAAFLAAFQCIVYWRRMTSPSAGAPRAQRDA